MSRAVQESWSYSGEVWTDDQGRAVVSLPPFVRAHVAGFDYELAPDTARIADPIADGKFAIASETPHVKVAWRVTPLREPAKEAAMIRRIVVLFAAVAALVPALARSMPIAPAAAIVSDVVNPFGACLADLPGLQRELGSIDFPSSEVEPQVAVNPTNPNNLIAVWQQDRWSDGGARANLAGVSFDGGDTWRVVRVTRSSACTGNPSWVRATDPWVTFAPDGTAYFMHLGIFSLLPTIDETIAADGMTVVRSTDGGLTWGAPATLVADFSPSVGHDKNTITADPNDSDVRLRRVGRVHKAALRERQPEASANSRAFGGPAIFTRSNERRNESKTIRVIFDPGSRKQRSTTRSSSGPRASAATLNVPVRPLRELERPWGSWQEHRGFRTSATRRD